MAKIVKNPYYKIDKILSDLRKSYSFKMNFWEGTFTERQQKLRQNHLFAWLNLSEEEQEFYEIQYTYCIFNHARFNPKKAINFHSISPEERKLYISNWKESIEWANKHW